MTPTIHKITRNAGIAGQVSVTAEVQYYADRPQDVRSYVDTLMAAESEG